MTLSDNCTAMPWLGLKLDGLSPRRSGFDSRPVHMGYMMRKLYWGTVHPPVSISPQMLHIHLFMYHWQNVILAIDRFLNKTFYCTPHYDTRLVLFLFFFQALNFLVGRFGLLNDLFPFPPILDAGYRVFFIFIWQMSCLMLSSHLYLVLFDESSP